MRPYQAETLVVGVSVASFEYRSGLRSGQPSSGALEVVPRTTSQQRIDMMHRSYSSRPSTLSVSSNKSHLSAHLKGDRSQSEEISEELKQASSRAPLQPHLF